MPVYFKVLRRISPVDKSAKYYACKVMNNLLDTNAVYEALAEDMQVPKTVALPAVAAIVKSIRNFCFNGHVVQIAQLGTFSCKCNSHGSLTADEVTADNIHRVSFRFTPCKEILEACKHVEFIHSLTADDSE